MGLRAGLVLGLWVMAAWLGTAFAQRAPAAQPPTNIVILFADDLGYGDLGVQGAKDVATPNIDRLAKEGVRLTNYYSNHPVCSPSRAALLTGKYQHRFGFENNSGAEENTSLRFGIPRSELNIAERLKPLGYATAVFGKWHVGFQPEFQPTSRGFDEFYGILGGANAFTAAATTGGKRVMRGAEPVDMPAHLTEAIGDEAVRFIDANKDKPFLLYVPFTAVHAPLQTTQPYLDRFGSTASRERRIYLGMLAAMDDQVGRIVDAVDRNGLGERTLILFASDNGGPTWQTTSSNAPLNGVKVLMLEGGIRVPAILRWPGKLPKGKTSDVMVAGFDLTATALAAAGAAADEGLDGVNLVPFLTGASRGKPHEALYWRSGGSGAMRKGDFKLVKVEDRTFLFNLRKDIGERQDLSTKDPKRLQAMLAEWQAWSDQMMKPQWVRNERAGGDPPPKKGEFRALYEAFVSGRSADAERLLNGGGARE